MATVLVTGGTGFIGAHCIAPALQEGHFVRTTMRNLARESELRAMLAEAGVEPGDRLQAFAADLERDGGWAEAAAGCDFVLHVASPFPTGVPKDADELVRPARDGALRVLRAARDAGVKRVVLTSSFAAIGYSDKRRTRIYDERDWTDPDAPGVQPYVKSKAVAERAAWDFIAREGGGLELAVVNPVAVFGPVLGPDYSTSIQLVKRLLDGSLPGCPRLYFGIVDVRDVAALHLTAMTAPEAAGERFLAVAGPSLSMLGIAQVLKDGLGPTAKKVPARELPDLLVKLLALAVPELRQVTPELGRRKDASNAKAREVLGWTPRSNEEAILATAKSLQRLGLV